MPAEWPPEQPAEDEPEAAPDSTSEETPADPHYHATWQAVLHSAPPQSSWGPALLLLGTLALFIFSMKGDFEWQGMATLVGVLFFHEMGHYAGMKLFGFGDVKMFFIPFFGAAVSGQKHSAPSWQHCIVLLLGPLPGILLGGVIYLLTRQGVHGLAGEAVLMLLALNAFNLLPVEPLDGGRFLNRILFSRHPLLEALFIVLAALGLGFIGWWFSSWILMGLAVIGLLSVIHRYQLARMARLVRRKLPGLPAELHELSEPEKLALYHTARSIVGAGAEPGNLSNVIKNLHQTAVIGPPGLPASVGLFALYLLGWVVAVATVVLMVLDLRPPDAEAHREYVARLARIGEFVEERERLEERADELAGQAKKERVAGVPRAEEEALRKRIRELEQLEQEARQRLSEDFEFQLVNDRMVIRRRTKE